MGVAYYSRGDVGAGDHELAAVRKLFNEQLAFRQAALDEAHRRPKVERTSAFGAVNKRLARPLASLESQIAQLEAYRRIVTGFFLSRGRLLVYLGLLVAGEAAAFWMLRRRMMRALLSGVAAALAAGWLFYCHLALVDLASDSTNVDFAFVTRKQLEAGDFDQALWSARQFARERPHQVRPQANLVEVLYKAGKKEEAREEFETLRELAGTADLDSPPLARLAPIGRALGLPTDWRRPEKIQEALAGRRPLPSLGPLEWRPWSAPDWTLTDGQGRAHRLAEFHGKPVVLLFFLGRGCLHCQQQLEAFAKKAEEFSKAGLTVIAVSTDDQAGIREVVGGSWSKAQGPRCPFARLQHAGLQHCGRSRVPLPDAGGSSVGRLSIIPGLRRLRADFAAWHIPDRRQRFRSLARRELRAIPGRRVFALRSQAALDAARGADRTGRARPRLAAALTSCCCRNISGPGVKQAGSLPHGRIAV